MARRNLKSLSRKACRLAELMFGCVQATTGGSPGIGGGPFFKSERLISGGPPAGPRRFLSTSNHAVMMSKIARTARDRIFHKREIAVSIRMVGTTGFEPATSRTPSVRATRLRYVPTGKLTATGQKARGPNRRRNQHLQDITAVRAASRKRVERRAYRAASCGSVTAPAPRGASRKYRPQRFRDLPNPVFREG